MRKTLLIVLLILVSGLLAACGGAEAPVDDANNADTQAESNGQADNSDAAEDSATPGGTTFGFEITGADERSVTSENVALNCLQAVSPDATEYFLNVFGMGQARYEIVITFPELTAGRYALSGPDAEGMATARYTTLDATGFSREFEQNVSGTLTLDSVNNLRINGSVEFTAEYIGENADGEDVTESVTITGSFSSVSCG